MLIADRVCKYQSYSSLAAELDTMSCCRCCCHLEADPTLTGGRPACFQACRAASAVKLKVAPLWTWISLKLFPPKSCSGRLRECWSLSLSASRKSSPATGSAQLQTKLGRTDLQVHGAYYSRAVHRTVSQGEKGAGTLPLMGAFCDCTRQPATSIPVPCVSSLPPA